MRLSILSAGLAGCCLFAVSALADSAGITRVPEPNFPISEAVKVPPGATTLYLSGMLASPTHPDAPKDSPAAYGDTAEQATSIFEKIKTALAAEGMGLGDVIAMHVFLVGDPAKGGKMDFAGLQAAYTKYFGTPQQPNKPVRAAFQIAGLVAPWALVEIEVTAAKAP